MPSPAVTSPDSKPLSPPVAAKRPYVVASPHGDRIDEYYWLRDDSRKAPEVIAHLEAENAWFAQHQSRYAPLEESLYREMRARIKEDDRSVPARHRGYWYWTQYETGAEYGAHWRRADTAEAVGELVLDETARAHGHDFYELGDYAVSPDGRRLAVAEDIEGRRQYVIRFLDLASGVWRDDVLTGSNGSMAFADDDTLFYVVNDPLTLRSCKVLRHRIGTGADADVTVYEEHDDAFYTGVSLTSSEAFVVISVSSTVSDEQHVIACADVQSLPKRLAERQRDFHYHADHVDGRWVIRTDWDAPNYRIMTAAEQALGHRDRWQPLIDGSDDVFIHGFMPFKRALVIAERRDANRQLRVVHWDGREAFTIAAAEPAYTASLDANWETDASVVRSRYSSLTTPTTIIETDLATGAQKTLKVQEVRGYDSANYVTERRHARAADGALVPVSLVRRRDTPQDGTAPALQYGYGAYGISMDPAFRSSIISLLDRGFVYAIAHVRGGQELGRAWYENGKKEHKMNSFTDFIAVTEMLVAERYADRHGVFAQGGSAGGLLMGAVMNLKPQYYRGILAQVPFVDVVTTMMDETLPLTTNEYDEWGDPRQAQAYARMLAYSPYDNVRAADYPALLVTTGLHDSQVQYFEPAKWVARLRARRTNQATLLFKTNMDAGHGGASGRFNALRETAEGFAFVLNEWGVSQ